MKSHFLQAAMASILAAVLMGSLGFFVRGVSVAPELTAFYRFSIGFVLMSAFIVYQLLRKTDSFSFSIHAFNSGIAISVCIVFYFIAMTKISIGMAAFLLYLAPVFATLGEIVFLKERPSLVQISLIISAFIGMMLLVFFTPQQTEKEVINGHYFQGLLYGLLAAISYAFYILLNRKIPEKMTLQMRCFWQFFAGVIVVGAINCNNSFAVPLADLPYIACVGLLQGLLVIILVAYAIRYLTAIQYGTLAYFEPVVAVVLGYICFSEAVSVIQCVGFTLIIISAMIQGLYTLKKTKKGELVYA